MLCFTSSGRCDIGRLLGDGRLILLYRISRPDYVPSSCVPNVTWSYKNYNTNITLNNQYYIPTVNLSTSWHGNLSLLEVPLIGDKLPLSSNYDINEINLR